MAKMKRKPSSPGTILKTLYLDELGVSITQFAEMIHVSRKAVSAIVNGRKSVTPEMALRFSIALDTTPEFWLNAQRGVDLWETRRNFHDNVQPLRKSA